MFISIDKISYIWVFNESNDKILDYVHITMGQKLKQFFNTFFYIFLNWGLMDPSVSVGVPDFECVC